MDLMYYSPMNVHASILGKDFVGYAEDEFITIEAQSENYTTKTSMDGMVQVSGVPVKTHVVTVALQATSPMNTLLHALMVLHKQFGSKLKLPLMIKSTDTNTTFSATDVWFKKEPQMAFGSGMHIVVWEFYTKNAVYAIGGNDDGSFADIAQMISQATQLAGYLNLDLDSMLGTAQGLFSQLSI